MDAATRKQVQKTPAAIKTRKQGDQKIAQKSEIGRMGVRGRWKNGGEWRCWTDEELQAQLERASPNEGVSQINAMISVDIDLQNFARGLVGDV